MSSAEMIEELLDSLGWDGQAGQMAQIDIGILLSDDHTELRQDLLDHYIGTLGVGSVLNNQNRVDPLWTIEDFRKATIQLQATAKKFNRPPVIWGLDSVHGANYLYNTIITPQPLNLAASFNTTLSYQAGEWASHDTRRAGIPWVFSPLLGLSWNSYWSRIYETFGEDPELVGSMAKAMITGIQLQDDSIVPSRTAACAKHFVGYSMPRDGHDRAPSWIPTRHLYQYFMPPWKQVLDQVDTVMESYTEIDGVPNVANRRTMSRMLRKELGFQGMLVTDYHEIFNLFEWHHTASDRQDALMQALEEGSVDMSMIANEPDDFFAVFHAINQTESFKERIRTSARRILQLKQKLHMFEESFNLTLTDDISRGPSKEDLQAALEMTQQSIILAKNKNEVMPLSSEKTLSVLVTGPTAASRSFQTGGWTWQWQGVNSNIEDQWFTYGSTVLQASQRESNWHVSYSCGVDIVGKNCAPDNDFIATEDQQGNGVMGTMKDWVGWNDKDSDESIDRAAVMAQDKDVIVVCLGEENYTEKPGDIRSLELPAGQYGLVQALRENAPSAKIVLVFFGGRPRLLADIEESVDAIFLGFLPGPYGGDALVDLITGRVNPSAHLPITYPKYEDGGGVPYLHAVSDMCTKDTGGTLPHFDNTPCEVQWPFGHGLSYAQFEFNNLTTSATVLEFRHGQKRSPSLTLTFKVRNTSNVAGAVPIMIFTFDEFRSTTPEYKRLRGFDKVWLEAMAEEEIDWEISLDDLRFVGPHDETHYVLQDGQKFFVGLGADVDCRVDPGDKKCSDPITIRTAPEYVGACEAACNLWALSGCGEGLGMTDDVCWNKCTSIHGDTGLQMNNDGWGWNYVDCLESLVWADKFDKNIDCWKLTRFCRDVGVTPGMDEFGGGVTPPAFLHTQSDSIGLVLALISGFLASVMVGVAMRGGCKKKSDEEYGDVQFSAVHTHELMT